MKALHTTLFLLFGILFFGACSKEDNTVQPNEIQGLQKVTTLSNSQHTIDVYTANGQFQTGYNAVYFQIKNSDGSLINNATANWTPLMHMMGMTHSCPVSSITKKENSLSTYMGYLIFQMAGSEAEYWELTLNYTVNGQNYTANSKIAVAEAPKRVVESFQGSDNNRYVLALIAPGKPQVGENEMKVAFYKMQDMLNFVPVNQYRIKIDPRMPGMGNHTSPNNTDLLQQANAVYAGKLNLTMTGYWRINLQVADAAGTILKGEAIKDAVTGSSLYFEVEF